MSQYETSSSQSSNKLLDLVKGRAVPHEAKIKHIAACSGISTKQKYG
jgi:hypothetical protein